MSFFFPLSCHPLVTFPPYKANEHTPFSPVVRARRPPIGCPTPRAAWVGWAEVSRRTVVIWGLYTRDLRTVPPLLPISPPPPIAMDRNGYQTKLTQQAAAARRQTVLWSRGTKGLASPPPRSVVRLIPLLDILMPPALTCPRF